MKRLAIAAMIACGWSAHVRAAEDPLDARVTVEFRNAAAADVIGAIVRGAGLTVRLGPGTLRPVTLAVSNVKLRNVLNALCDTALCTWRVNNSALTITPLPSEGAAALPARLSLEVHDVSPADVFRALAAAIDVPITIEGEFPAQPVSMGFGNAATVDALNLLCQVQQCEWDYDPVRGLRITRKR